MPRATLTITGLRETKAALLALALSVPRALPSAVRKGLEEIESRVLEEIPRDSGNMAAHVGVEVSPPRAGRVHGETAIRGVDYAAHVDLGTRSTRADDFMQRAFDHSARKAAATVEAEIRKSIT